MAETNEEAPYLFESLGNNCELGIVQRLLGADPPGIFRNVGFLDPYQMVNVIERGLDGMFEPDNFVWTLPDGWHDWRLDCRISGLALHTAISSDVSFGSPEWQVQSERVITTFNFLKRKFLRDLEEGAKVFTFRAIGPINTDAAQRLHAAVRRFGPGRVLVVGEDSALSAPEVEQVGKDLYFARMKKLSNENPPIVDIDGWRSIFGIVLRGNSRSGDGAKQIKNIFRIGNSDPSNEILVIAIHNGQSVGFGSAEARMNVFLDPDWRGREVSLFFDGLRSEEFNVLTESDRGGLRTIFVRSLAESEVKTLTLCLRSTGGFLSGIGFSGPEIKLSIA